MQAITVKYLSPTNTQGARLKADTKAGSVIVGYPYHTQGETAARIAAYALCEKFHWQPHNLEGGQLKNGDYVFIFVDIKEK